MQNLNKVQRTSVGKLKPMNSHDTGLHAAKQSVHPMNPGMLIKHHNTMRQVASQHTMGTGGQNI